MMGLTYLHAYDLAENEKTRCVDRRQAGNFGIAVDKDEHARLWQRRERQARKFYQRTAQQLIQSEPDGDWDERHLCLLCFYPRSACEHHPKFQRRYIIEPR